MNKYLITELQELSLKIIEYEEELKHYYEDNVIEVDWKLIELTTNQIYHMRMTKTILIKKIFHLLP